MGLSKATNASVEKTGFWIFTEWRVYFTKRQYFRFTDAEFKRLLARQGAVEIGSDGRRTLWMVDEGFYWDSDDLTADDVELLVWDRQRRSESRLNRLRTIKERGEAAVKSRRDRIPDDVRAYVWERDEGRCVRCDSEDRLQFDHLIPVAKGGGNGPDNIQLLCDDCNLLKSDSIV